MSKGYHQTAESGNQTSWVSFTSAIDKDPNETVIDTGNGEIENAKQNVEVRHSATHGSRKEPSFANSRSSRWHIDEIELETELRKKQSNDCESGSWSKSRSVRKYNYVGNKKNRNYIYIYSKKKTNCVFDSISEPLKMKGRNLKGRAKAHGSRIDEREFKSIWFSGRRHGKCWIITQAKKNYWLGIFSDPPF